MGVRDHMAALDLNAQRFEAKVLDIAGNADRDNGNVGL